MARDEAMHRLLLDWAQWMRVGDGSGYPTKSVLHPTWTPPGGGVQPPMKVAAPDGAKRTNAIMRHWSATMRATVMLYYCFPGLTLARQAERLACAERTVLGRIERAHQLLRQALPEAKRDFCNMREMG